MDANMIGNEDFVCCDVFVELMFLRSVSTTAANGNLY
jgi:hypothetical protein